MNKHLIFALVLFLFVRCNQNKVEVFFENDIIDLGEIYFGETINDSIRVENLGDGILEILDVQADCGCTVPKISNNKILPNEIGYIKFSFHPNTTGHVQQKITFKNNSLNHPEKIILIRALVKL